MVRFIGEGTGRVIVLNLKRGELLLETIEQELATIGIKNAIITSAIGSLKKAVFHRVTGMEREPVDEFITLEKPLELASLQGIVVDGHPHFHMVISDVESPYTGHLEPGTEVLYLVEITLLEVRGLNLHRVKDQDNIATLTQK
ncbi:MAG TPA: PPC domain-containing DNA-binding protein [Ruminiclostridium sp.]